MCEKRITVHFSDNTERTMVVDSITADEYGIIHFGRDGMEFLAAPRENILYWDGVSRA